MSFTQTKQGLRYTERIGVAVRLFAGFIGLAMFAIPYPFIVYNDWTQLSFASLVAVFGVAFPVFAGVLFLAIALAGELRLEFDRTGRQIHSTRIGPLGRGRSVIAYEAIERIGVERREGEDSTWYVLALARRDKPRPLILGDFKTEAGGEVWRQRLAEEFGLSFDLNR